MSPLRSRLQLSFAWILWTDPRVTNMMYDVEKSHVFTWPENRDLFLNTFDMNWDDAYGICGQLGGGWELAVITANHENAIVSMPNTTLLPINQIRNASGMFVWSNSERATWFNWYVDLSPRKEPGVDPLFDCSHIDASLEKAWDDSKCREAKYTVSPCEAPVWEYSGSVSFIADKNTVQKNFSVPQPMHLSQKPADTMDTIYGATVILKVKDCKQLDRFLFNIGHDKIYVAYDQDCMVMLAGLQTMEEYNKIVLSLEFSAVDTTRAALDFGFVYWTDFYIRDMVPSIDTLHVYTSYGKSLTMEPEPTNPTYPARIMCQDVGFYPAELDDNIENYAVLHGQLFGETFWGGYRYGTSLFDFYLTRSEEHTSA